MSECPPSPVYGMPPKRPSSFLLHPKYQVVNCVTGKTAVRAQSGMYQRAADPINSFAGCIRKPIPSCWGCLTCGSLQLAHRHPPNAPCTLPLHLPIGAHIGPAPVYTLEAVRMNFCRQGALAESWPDSAELEETTQALAFSTALGKAEGGYQHLT